MLKLYVKLQNLRTREDGASAVEYGLLVALIAAVLVAAVIIFGDFIQGIFRDTCTAIDSGASAGRRARTAPDSSAVPGWPQPRRLGPTASAKNTMTSTDSPEKVNRWAARPRTAPAPSNTAFSLQ